MKDHFRGDTRDTYRGAMRADINRLRLSKELTGGWRTLAALPALVEVNQQVVVDSSSRPKGGEGR